MKKILPLAAAALLVLSAGCAPGAPASSAGNSGEVSSAAEPLAIETLTVELPREGDTAAARAVMERLPELLAPGGVLVEEVAVTYGTSHAATAAALDDGGVMLAFLPAEDFVRCCARAVPLLADGREGYDAEEAGLAAWNAGAAALTGETAAGTYALVCAAPTAYGARLAALCEERALTWEEVSHARWGVLSQGSDAGCRCAELWLEDRYAAGLSDLPDVREYDGWEDLLRAAAGEEIDLLPLAPEARERYAPLWAMEPTRTDDAGVRGFGRTGDLFSQLPVLAVTERLFSCVAAVTPEDAAVNTDTFRRALADALEAAFSDPAERLAALGAERFAPIEPSALDPLRRLTLGR